MPTLPHRSLSVAKFRLGSIAVLLCLAVSGCSDNNNSGRSQTASDPVVEPAVNPFEGYASAQYDAADNWLCRPDIEGVDNACNGDLSATIVFADGSTALELFNEVEDPAVDCFYVYPTVSNDPTANSDLEPGIEGPVAGIQAARYRSVCKMYAPVYRQLTAAGLAAALAGEDIDIDAVLDLAYADVLDAFKQFIANAEGRGFVLIGHSQGSSHLIRLIQEEIESDAYLSERMITAHIIGMLVELPLEDEVGATFASTPPCSFDAATGCFVNFSSFNATNPPTPETGFFGIARTENTRAACTHPVDLGAGRLTLDAYFSTFQVKAYNDPALNAGVTTPFIKLPDLIQGECIEQDAKGYLAITLDADPADPRIDDLGNEGRVGWGLHTIDMGLGQGDLARLAQRQVDEWLGQQ